MSANFLTKLSVRKGDGPAPGLHASFGMAVGLVLWTLLTFSAARFLPLVMLYALRFFGVPLESIDQAAYTAVSAAVVYGTTILLLIGLPWLLKKSRTSSQDLGLTRLISWADMGLAPLGFIVYLLVSGLLVYAVSQLVPGIDLTQAQETGFDGGMRVYYQYLLALAALVVIAPIAEEIIFRGYLYGKLRKAVPVWLAMLITSAAFGLAHGQWNVGIDVFALSMVACSLREITGSVWAGVLLHMLKNSLAYYILFINPVLSHTIGG